MASVVCTAAVRYVKKGVYKLQLSRKPQNRNFIPAASEQRRFCLGAVKELFERSISIVHRVERMLASAEYTVELLLFELPKEESVLTPLKHTPENVIAKTSNKDIKFFLILSFIKFILKVINNI